eukprot:Gregarina_sp_Pseudo_9__5206@NODE_573_length_2559_cov_4_080159_g542_i0_p1_GENE_NODE_573_length_2559_cov_4_080159_g542_i0NODE_573_length_2559_cov_4_080159_g542_i0_p1_ORF_typecomplete_len818_score166_20HEAT_2/PF13646_6/11HEAT_2/PF13646_6/0_19HEAT_2/PF13646_6/99Nop14/PF04147_12/0_0022Herpes_LMP1/PF05297_11/0_0015SDA1/PF05285_12/0_014FAM35_C/PF15793_5/0_41FAM35_C/PF15793_5/2_2e03TFIIA/PF03153_13/0_17DUF2201_N/PF13203_6/0_32RPN1_RPN2_N/PF17781_1/1_1e03RPN1_RPN2_N/PF17781_1/0_56SURF2/PF05477_11/0_76NOA
MQTLDVFTELSTYVVKEKMSPEAFLTRLARMPAKGYAAAIDEIAQIKMKEFKRANKPHSAWQFTWTIVNILEELEGKHKVAPGGYDIWPYIKELLEMRGRLAHDNWSLDHMLPKLLRFRPELVDKILQPQIEADFDMLGARSVCEYVMRRRMDLLAKFFEGNLRRVDADGKVSEDCVRLGCPNKLYMLPKAWQLKYAEELLRNIKPQYERDRAEAGETRPEADGAMNDGEEATEKAAAKEPSAKEKDAADDNAADDDDDAEDDDEGDDEDADEGKRRGYQTHYSHEELKTLASLPALPWTFLVENIIEVDPTQQPEWLAKRGIYALAKMDDIRALEYLRTRTEVLQNKESMYAVAPSIAKMPPAKALECLRRVAMKQVSVYKQVVRTLGSLGTKDAQQELFRIFKDPSTHNHVRIAVIRGLWGVLFFPSTWDFLETEAAPKSTWNVCRKMTEITNYRLALTSRDRLVKIFALLLERNEYKLSSAIMNRMNWMSLGDRHHVLVKPCIKLVNIDQHNRSTYAQLLTRELAYADAATEAAIQAALLDHATEWLGHVQELSNALSDTKARDLLRTMFARVNQTGDLVMLCRLLAVCNDKSSVKEQIFKHCQNEVFVYLYTESLTNSSFSWGMKDQPELAAELCAHPDPKIQFMGLLFKTVRSAGTEESLQIYEKCLEESEDPVMRSWCRWNLDNHRKPPLKPTPKRRRPAKVQRVTHLCSSIAKRLRNRETAHRPKMSKPAPYHCWGNHDLTSVEKPLPRVGPLSLI